MIKNNKVQEKTWRVPSLGKQPQGKTLWLYFFRLVCKIGRIQGIVLRSCFLILLMDGTFFQTSAHDFMDIADGYKSVFINFINNIF